MKPKYEKIKEGANKSSKPKSIKPLILFMAFDKEDNNKFVAKISNAVLDLNRRSVKITPSTLSAETKYSIREIELNLNEITIIMDGLGIE